jgi:hypothetical protein
MRSQGKKMVRALLAALGLVVLAAGVALAEAEEVEHYDSLAALTTHADAVVVGTVVSTAPGVAYPAIDCGFTNATVRVESLVAGSLPAFATKELTLLYFGCGTLPALGADIPAERSIFFLRNGRTDRLMAKANATTAELQAAWHLWRLEIFAGTGVDQAGIVAFPVLDNAFFLKPFAGLPFAEFVARVRSLASAAPNTTTVPSSPRPSPPAIPLLAGLIALSASVIGSAIRARLIPVRPLRCAGARFGQSPPSLSSWPCWSRWRL